MLCTSFVIYLYGKEKNVFRILREPKSTQREMSRNQIEVPIYASSLELSPDGIRVYVFLVELRFLSFSRKHMRIVSLTQRLVYNLSVDIKNFLL